MDDNTETTTTTTSTTTTTTTTTTKCSICNRTFRPNESQHNIDEHVKSHDYVPPPPRKKKKTPLPKGTKSLLNYFSTVEEHPPPPPPPPLDDSSITIKEPVSTSVPHTLDDVEAVVHSVARNDSDPIAENRMLASSSRSSIEEVKDYIKCAGITPSVPPGSNIYESFPFPVLKSKDFVFEHDAFHHISCAAGKYIVAERTMEMSVPVNKSCFNLKFSDSFKRLETSMLDTEYYKTTTNDEYLSHLQLKQRLDKSREDTRKLQFESWNLLRKVNRLNKTLQLHERLLILLKDNNVPRLREVIGAAMKANRNINYIVGKVVAAVEGIYRAHPNQDDKDLAFLIWQIGGPALLDICHRAIGLPSNSTAYRMIKGKKFINSSLQATAEDAFSNITISKDVPKYGHMLKIDETYVDSKIRWSPVDNKIYGFCYDHGCDEELEFNSYEDVCHLADLVEEDKLHVAKECKVVVTSCNAVEEGTQVVLAWPTCSKSETDIQKKFIEEFSNFFFQKTGAPLLCWATDGDGARRQIFDFLMCHLLSKDSKIYPIMSTLKLLDLYVGLNEETVDFDGKHLAKRMRNSVIAQQFQVGTTVITRKNIESILSLSTTNKHGVEQLVNPADKQNVSLATDLLSTFSKAVKKPELASCGFRIVSIVPVLKLLGLIMEGILALYSFVTASIEEQLVFISTAAHSLLVLKKIYGTILPNQLYHDLMSTFQNVMFCAAKFQVNHPLLPFLIVLLGSEAAERLFGNIRLKYKHNGLDCLELLYCARGMKEISKILNKHPDWTNKSSKVMSRLCLDYSKPSNWQLEKLTMQDVNIKQCWDQGRINVESFIIQDKLPPVDFFQWFSDGITMLKPNGQKIGVTELTEDWSCEDVENAGAPENEDSNRADQDQNALSEDNISNDTDVVTVNEVISEDSDESATLLDVIEETSENGTKSDPQISVNGTWFYKSTILKQTFIGRKASRDRLRRVQGLSKNITEKNKQLDLDDVLFPGDPVLYLQSNAPKLGSIVKMLKGGKKVKLLKGAEIQSENVFIVVKQLELEDDGTVLQWSGEHSSKPDLKVAGKYCHTIQPDVEIREDKAIYMFDKSLVFDLGISMQSSQPAAASSSNDALKNCFLCQDMVALEDMRVHVGKHILNGDCGRSPCGTCGRDGCCENKLVEPTRKGNKVFYNKVQSNCKYTVHVARRVQKASARHPCTNYLNKCTVCKADVWHYNMKTHYEDMHPEFDNDDVPTVDSEEVKLMKKKRK